jgi:hypothetical protein
LAQRALLKELIMKHVKTLGLLAVTATALLAFTGVASASTVKSGGANYTSTIAATSTNFQLHGSFVTVSCTTSHLKGNIESHGAAITTFSATSSFSLTGCNYTVTVKKAGNVTFHTTTTPNATLTWSGGEMEIHTSIGGCVFTTNNTPIGTLTGGTGAKLDIDSSAIPRTGGSFFCGSSGEMTGNYTFSTPSNLTLH